jgi:dTDP-4-dehydrorhamnose reductase
MKLLLTGLNGTLAPRVAEAAARTGFEVRGWDRGRTDPQDPAAVQRELDALQPDAIAHLAMGSEAWAGQLAAYAATAGIPFLFSSTAMVFHHEPDGPHAVGDAPTAQDDYGRYKIRCEEAIRVAHAGATIVRIGWQIDASQPGNNMLRALDEWQARDGEVAASTAWRPACSYMEDTAAAFVALLRAPRPGVFHFDSNADGGHSFAQIVRALRQTHGRDAWRLREHADYVHDQRLIGDALQPPPLADRLPGLAA